ncbi:nitroreductase family protein [Burkholderia sp. L27(2015)]|uniref:nitroreductase family protein n=1 Tax=Burkholderia sp. L27(2015) TaxID=1641858 RepID=UPI00131E00B2|nr:nitroreductase family protein [Burkholderia sp. L27(2015)]
MNVLDAVHARRSIKRFDPQHEMPAADEKQLFSAALCSPTAFNIQNWRFVMLQDRGLRNAVRAVAWDQPQVADASLVIALCADLNAWEREPRRYWKNAAKPVQEMILPAIDQYYRDKPAVQRDEAMRSCGILAQTLMLAAKSLGYDSCPMDGFDFDAVAKLINLPDDHVITMLLAIGKATDAPWPRGGQIPLSEVMVFNRFE